MLQQVLLEWYRKLDSPSSVPTNHSYQVEWRCKSSESDFICYSHGIGVVPNFVSVIGLTNSPFPLYVRLLRYLCKLFPQTNSDAGV